MKLHFDVCGLSSFGRTRDWTLWWEAVQTGAPEATETFSRRSGVSGRTSASHIPLYSSSGLLSLRLMFGSSSYSNSGIRPKIMRSPVFRALSLTVAALLVSFVLRAAALKCQDRSSQKITVGSKAFTESVILSEIVTQLLGNAGFMAVHRDQLGGTRFVWNALIQGEIDIYPEYTGTIIQEVLAGHKLSSEVELQETLPSYNIRMSAPLGFNNTYALGMKENRAQILGIRRISDLRHHPALKFGFSNEFMDRGDGWPSLRLRYKLPQVNVQGVDHDLAYRGIESGSVDVIDLYSTDAEIDYHKLRVLQDDLHHFPDYKAVLLFRADLIKRRPGALAVLRQLEGLISEQQMIRMNASAKIDRVPENQVAAAFLNETLKLDTSSEATVETRSSRLWTRTREHLYLVSLSLWVAILVGIPLGIVAAKLPNLGQLILSTVSVIYTIPSLALLVFMIQLLGIGGPPALVALFLYSLLPIVRNTHAGLNGISPEMIESAEALGLPPLARLRLVELPLAARSILAGIKTSAVINVGTATLGALIGAGGYGQPILTGIRLDNVGLILEGAIPAAVLALAVQGIFELAERIIVPKGLRLTAEVQR